MEIIGNIGILKSELDWCIQSVNPNLDENLKFLFKLKSLKAPGLINISTTLQ